MIRKLTEKDREKLLLYVSKEPEINLFIIGDVENFGFDKDYQTLWGEFDDDGNYKAVMIKYYENVVIYSDGDFSVKEFVDIIKKLEYRVISCCERIADTITKFINYKNKRTLYYCKLDNLKEIELDRSIKISKTKKENVSGIVELFGYVDEFTSTNEESLFKDFETKSPRGYYIEENNKIVSSVKTTAENTLSAMIVGVATHPSYRKKGYATACMHKLCSEVLTEGKTLCLFYDNPKAGKIYKRLGFYDIDKWVMFINKK